MNELAAVCPGDRLAPSAEFEAGPGTHLSKDGKHIHSSLVGLKQIVPATDKKPTLQVVSIRPQVLTPSPGDVVTCKVTRINPRLASADIICVGTQPLEEKFTGVIRLQDVRATEIDKIDIASCFRPGDIVRAHIVSLGTHRDYYLSTAKNELGVVYAKSLAGDVLTPEQWCWLMGTDERGQECGKGCSSNICGECSVPEALRSGASCHVACCCVQT